MADEPAVSKMLWRELAAEYVGALRNLHDLFFRLAFKRRNLEDELAEASLRGVLRRAFGCWELLLLGCGIVVGTGIYSTTGKAAWIQAGPAVVISYALGGLASLLAGLVFGEFAMEYPVSGGGFTYCMLTFGELPAFLTLSNLVLSYVVGMASVAGQISFNLSALTNYNVDFIVGASNATWNLDFFAFAAVLAATGVLSLGAREYAYLVSGATLLKLAALLTIIIAAFTKADPSQIEDWTPTGVEAVFSAMQISYYSYVGFEALTNTVEEAQNPSDVPKALFGTVLIAGLIYILLALSFVLLMPYEWVEKLLDPSYLLSRVFTIQGSHGSDCSHCVGMQWLQFFISATALVAVVTSLFVGLYSLARLVMVAARDWLLPPCLAVIYPRTQTPLAAQITVGAFVSVIALVIPVERLAVLVSWGTLFAMWMVCNAHLFRRYYPDLKLRYTKYGQVEAVAAKRQAWRPKLPSRVQKAMVWVHMVLLSAVTVGLSIYWRTTPDRTASFAFVGAWALVTLSFQLVCPLEYQPAAKWAVPWWAMPWLPSLAIALIIFSLGSLTAREYWHVAVFFAVSLMFYLLYSLPMSYLKRRRLDYVNTEQMNVVELALRDGKWVMLDTAGSAISGMGPLPRGSPPLGPHSSAASPSLYSLEGMASKGPHPSGAFTGSYAMSQGLSQGSGVATAGYSLASHAHGTAGVSLGLPRAAPARGASRVSRPSILGPGVAEAGVQRRQQQQRQAHAPARGPAGAAGQQIELQQQRGRAPPLGQPTGLETAAAGGLAPAERQQQQPQPVPHGQGVAPPLGRLSQAERSSAAAAAAATAVAAAFRSQTSYPSWRGSAITDFGSAPESMPDSRPGPELRGGQPGDAGPHS